MNGSISGRYGFEPTPDRSQEGSSHGSAPGQFPGWYLFCLSLEHSNLKSWGAHG